MTIEELQKHCTNKQVLWLVWGSEEFVHMDTVKLIDCQSQWGICVWGYSVYRRSPGFRTIGQSLASMLKEHSVVKLFVDQTEAIEFYQKTGSTELSFEELKAKYTPNLKFLKKENYRHNLSVEL